MKVFVIPVLFLCNFPVSGPNQKDSPFIQVFVIPVFRIRAKAFFFTRSAVTADRSVLHLTE